MNGSVHSHVFRWYCGIVERFEVVVEMVIQGQDIWNGGVVSYKNQLPHRSIGKVRIVIRVSLELYMTYDIE